MTGVVGEICIAAIAFAWLFTNVMKARDLDYCELDSARDNVGTSDMRYIQR